MGTTSVVFPLLLIALCCHGYGALPAVESTTESKSTTASAGKLEAKAAGVSVRFGNFEADDKDKLMFPGISNRAFGSFGSAGSSSLSSSSDSSSSASSSAASSSESVRKVGGIGYQRPAVRPERPAELQQIPLSPCQTCCKTSPCGARQPPVRPPYIPDQGTYGPPQYGGSDVYYPDFGGRPYPDFNQGGYGSYSNSQASSSSGYNKYGNNGYQHGGNQIFPGYPGGNFGTNHVGGGNPYYPARPIGSGSSASSSSNSYAGSNNGGYPLHPGYPGVPGYNQNYPGVGSGSFSSSSSSSSAGKGGSYSSSNSQSSSGSGNVRPVRPVQPPYLPEVPPEFNLPDGMCGSSAC